MTFNNKIFTFIILLIIGITFSTSLVQAVNSATNNHYQVTKSGGNNRIDEWNACRQVVNNRSLNIFIPTKTSFEWAEFRFNHPNNITLRGCGNIDVDSTTQNSITLDYSFEGCTTNVYIFRGNTRIGSSLGVGSRSGSYTDTGLTAGTSYTYYLREGSSTLSTELDRTTDTTNNPIPSGNISVASKTQTSVNLRYDYANAGSVNIFRGSSRIRSVGTGTGSGTYNNTGLSAGTSYTYYLRNGTSSTSPELDRVVVTTNAPTLYNLSVSSSGASSVYINGTPNTYDGTTNYTRNGITSGTTLTLVALSTKGTANFSSWSGCTSTSGRTCYVTMNSNKSVTANYTTPAVTRTLSVSSSGASSVYINGTPNTYDGTTNYTRNGITSGTTLTLVALSTKGTANFSSWSGCTSTSGRTCYVTMSSNKTVTATYTTPAVTRTLSVNSSGASSVSIMGSLSTYNGTTNYNKTGITSGTTLYLVAPSTKGTANFSSWSGCTSVNGRVCYVTMSSNKTATAIYTTPAVTRTLSVNSSGASSVYVSGSPSTYAGTTNYTRNGITSGTNLVLTAPSTKGTANFSSWSGCTSVNGRTCSVTMNSNKSVTANYTTPAVTRTLSVNSSGASSVYVSGSPSTYAGTTNYTRNGITSGTTLTLVAPSTKGTANFSSWSGCTSVNGRTCSVTMSSNKTVTATYTTPAVTRTLSVNSSGASSVYINGTPNTYDGTTNYTRNGITSGTTLTLVAPSTKGTANFSSWSGCTSVNGRTCSVTMNSNKTATATYTTPAVGWTCNPCVSTEPLTPPYLYNINQTIKWEAHNTSGTVNWTGDCTGSGTTCSKSFSSPGRYESYATYSGTKKYQEAGVCNYGTNYNSCSKANSLSSGTAEDYFCTANNASHYHKVVVPSGQTCNVSWEIYTPVHPFGGWTAASVTDPGYTLYTRSTTGGCPSTSTKTCSKTVYRYGTNSSTCTSNSVSGGTYYAMVKFKNWGYAFQGPPIYYRIKATVSGCTGGGGGTTSRKKVFVTSTSWNGNLGGVSGANAKCQAAANSAGLSGTYKAWISTSSSSPSSSFAKSSNGYEDTKGNKIADSWSDLTDGSIDRKINYTEGGSTFTKGVWTGTTKNGTLESSTRTCSNWTTNSSSKKGRRGYSNYSSSAWTDYYTSTCNGTRSLYCFQQ